MSWVAAAVAGGAIIGGVLSSNATSDAADTASEAQLQANATSVAEQQRQFDAFQKLIAPYVSAGERGLAAQSDFLGFNGASAQQQAYAGIENGAGFRALAQQGENAILQNASATGGLRGGNTQAALAQFRPQLLNQMLEQQYSKLSGMSSLGQNAAVMQGNMGQQSTNNITGLMQSSGAAMAGNALAQGQAQSQMYNSFGQGLGAFAAIRGGF